MPRSATLDDCSQFFESHFRIPLTLGQFPVIDQKSSAHCSCAVPAKH